MIRAAPHAHGHKLARSVMSTTEQSGGIEFTCTPLRSTSGTGDNLKVGLWRRDYGLSLVNETFNFNLNEVKKQVPLQNSKHNCFKKLTCAQESTPPISKYFNCKLSLQLPEHNPCTVYVQSVRYRQIGLRCLYFIVRYLYFSHSCQCFQN